MKFTDAQLFMLFILGLWILWVVSGGPEKYEKAQRTPVQKTNQYTIPDGQAYSIKQLPYNIEQ